MPTWPIYRLSINATKQEKREGAITFEGNDEQRMEFLSQIYRRIAFAQIEIANKEAEEQGLDVVAVQEPLGCIGVSAERHWILKGRPTLFVEEAQLVKNLYECNYNIGIDGICLPGSVLSISFPDNLVIDGVKLPPCLFFKTEIPADKSETGEPLRKVSVVVRSGYAVFEVSSVCNQEQLDLVLNRGREGVVQVLGEQNLDDEELKRMSVLFRVILSLSAYLSTFPEALRPGFPETSQKFLRNAAKELDKAQPVTLTLIDKLRNSPDGHFRRSHFRTLYDERYKRNPDGSYRSVFVSKSFVGGRNLDPSTIAELKASVKD